MDFQELYQDFEKAKDILFKTQNFFITKTNLTPIMSIELEFVFLASADTDTLPDIKELNQSIEIIAQNHGIKIGSIAKETAKLQYEINFIHSDDIIKIANNLIEIKNILLTIATKL